MRFSIGWRLVLSAWALVLILVLAGFAAVELAPSLGLSGAHPELEGARIPQRTRVPQYDPFDLGPPPFENAEPDLHAPGESTE